MVDYGRLARMRLLDGRTGANGRSLENAMRIILLNFSYVIIQKLPIIHCMKDLDCLPTIGSNCSIFWNKVIDFEECVRQGYDAIELCWYGSEYKDKKADDMYFGLYGWDCDSIVILNPSVVVPI